MENYKLTFKSRIESTLQKVSEKGSNSQFFFDVFRGFAIDGIPFELIPDLYQEHYKKPFPKELLPLLQKQYKYIEDTKPSKKAPKTKSDPRIPKNVQIENFIKTSFKTRFNTITENIEFSNKDEEEWSEMNRFEFNSMMRIMRNMNIHVKKDELSELLKSDFSTYCNPLVSYYDQLPAWDGETDYIGQLANTVETKNPEQFYKRLRTFLLGMVACSYKNSPNHSVFILVGSQGSGKTSWLRKLCPEKLLLYYYEGAINPENKDHLLYLCTKIIINIDELANFNKSDHEAFKSLTSSREQFVRKPYAENPQYYHRTASFVGSINNYDFLRDITGSRRYACFEVFKINAQHNVDIDMVYAQALALYKAGETYYITEDEIAEIEEANQDFSYVSPEEMAIKTYMTPVSAKFESAIFENATSIVQLLFERKILPKYDAAVIGTFGKLLKKLKFESKKIKGIAKYAFEWTEEYDTYLMRKDQHFAINSEEIHIEGLITPELKNDMNPVDEFPNAIDIDNIIFGQPESIIEKPPIVELEQADEEFDFSKIY